MRLEEHVNEGERWKNDSKGLSEPHKKSNSKMGFWRAVFCLILPPLAVIDKGCGAILIVTILTCFAWIPGVIAALIFSLKSK